MNRRVPEVCTQPLVTGNCRALFQRWGYRNGKCVTFIYGGCGGNDNNFTTKRKCKRACRSKGPVREKCGPLALVGVLPGGCTGTGARRVYAYDPNAGQCRQFRRCEVGSHVFRSQRKCRRTCDRK
ncbi:hypothetical protein EB796_015266 [Bugula neritina]|uniref:BPTI/Kunitz inhibitor domain-containing protein n=1 Tax=Bugula neritina TaxID=10212 RepID=A0A7J7JK36_BUGNE|nr:hypothetical protein EB796_015266 [Bugula neritina]